MAINMQEDIKTEFSAIFRTRNERVFRSKFPMTKIIFTNIAYFKVVSCDN